MGSALLVGAVYHHHPYQDGHGDSNEDGLGDDFNHYPTHRTNSYHGCILGRWQLNGFDVGDRNDCKQCH